MAKKFQKRVESFVCEKCKTFVEGGGYTDHCYNCLWSKHLDKNPGDRAASCKGMMEPEGVERKGEGFVIYYRCTLCDFKHKVKSSKKDNILEIIKISKNTIKRGKKRRN